MLREITKSFVFVFGTSLCTVCNYIQYSLLHIICVSLREQLISIREHKALLSESEGRNTL